jgi:membrane associated rhomboid family serine protease
MEQDSLSGLMSPTNIIVAVTVVLSFMAFSNQELLSKLIFNPYTIKNRKQYYRFITSGLIHNDHMHLIFNMISLYFFGAAVEMVFSVVFGALGPLYFVALYVLGIIVSDIPTYFKNQNNPSYNALGASGGVSSVVFAFILFLPLEKINLYFFIPIPGFILGALYIFYSWYSSRKASDNVNHDAHLYGALFGLVFCIVLFPQAVPNFFRQLAEWKMF